MITLLKQLKIDYRIRLGYRTAFVLVLIANLITLFINRQLKQQAKRINHTNTVITDLEYLVSYMKDEETGIRGFIIMKDTLFLEPFYRSFTSVKSMMQTLSKETGDNPLHQRRLDTLDRLVEAKYSLAYSSINYMLANKFTLSDSLLNNGYYGRIVMDSIRVTVLNMQNNEKELLSSRTAKLESQHVAMNIFVITSLVLATLFALFGYITYLRENTARIESDKKVAEYQEQLQNRIEELNNANKELIQMRSMEKFAATGRMARTIAHEVRNPLTNIELAMSQLKTDISNQDENTNIMFEIVARNSKRINQLITELLSATRFTDLKYETVSLNGLLDEALELAKDRLSINKIAIKKNYSTEIGDIRADKEKLRIAFLNLIVNAAEAMEGISKPELKIDTKLSGTEYIIEIADNGVGIEEPALSNLFEPYFTTKSKGNGLGLTNTQNIILNHKGNIHVESTLGKGTTFIIEFDIEQVNDTE